MEKYSFEVMENTEIIIKFKILSGSQSHKVIERFYLGKFISWILRIKPEVTHEYSYELTCYSQDPVYINDIILFGNLQLRIINIDDKKFAATSETVNEPIEMRADIIHTAHKIASVYSEYPKRGYGRTYPND